jgi:multimeric flavodoxin WrbA
MRITAFIGSARKKKHTYNATEQFLQNLESAGDTDIDYEIVTLSDYELKVCMGCKLCFDKGKEACPLKDDRDKLIEKIHNSDGIILATPNYSFQVSALMKIFLDRIAFMLHRPRFFGKAFTSIVAQGLYGGDKIVKYLDFVGDGLGFNVVNGSCLTALEPMPEKDRKKIDRILQKHSRRYYKTLIKKELPKPGLFKLMVFKLSRTSIKSNLDENSRDYTYYQEKGWFESNYYYDVKLNPIKKLMSNFFELMANLMFGGNKNRNRK